MPPPAVCLIHASTARNHEWLLNSKAPAGLASEVEESAQPCQAVPVKLEQESTSRAASPEAEAKAAAETDPHAAMLAAKRYSRCRCKFVE